MKYKILLLAIIAIFTTNNIFAQITWDNATTFEISESNTTSICSGEYTVYALHQIK